MCGSCWKSLTEGGEGLFILPKRVSHVVKQLFACRPRRHRGRIEGRLSVMN